MRFFFFSCDLQQDTSGWSFSRALVSEINCFAAPIPDRVILQAHKPALLSVQSPDRGMSSLILTNLLLSHSYTFHIHLP